MNTNNDVLHKCTHYLHVYQIVTQPSKHERTHVLQNSKNIMVLKGIINKSDLENDDDMFLNKIRF